MTSRSLLRAHSCYHETVFTASISSISLSGRQRRLGLAVVQLRGKLSYSSWEMMLSRLDRQYTPWLIMWSRLDTLLIPDYVVALRDALYNSCLIMWSHLGALCSSWLTMWSRLDTMYKFLVDSVVAPGCIL